MAHPISDRKERKTVMNATSQISEEQRTLWNGPAGRAWVDLQDLLDRVLKPMEDRLTEAAVSGRASRLLDVGCGTGSTTLGIARRLGPEGSCVGIDISAPMIAVARDRAEAEALPADFVCDDAQTHGFAPEGFDMIVSRFGIMFFEDPVAAFANLRRAARAGARLHVIAWRGPAENSFMTTAERAAAPLLPDLPARRPDAPGQFAFADEGRVRGILEDSGWAEIDIRPVDFSCSLPAADLERYYTRLGPVGLALQEADEALRTQVADALRAAFDPYVHGPEARFTAACWFVSAQVPSV
jgi:SAM-dependent methyltransferase